MGVFSAGVGLISGMDIEAYVEALMGIEHRPVDLLNNQIARLNAERTAMMTVSSY